MRQRAKIEKNKDYRIECGYNDYHTDEQEQKQISKFFPQLYIRCDIVWQLTRFGYQQQYVLNSIADCEPNYCYAAYCLLEQDH